MTTDRLSFSVIIPTLNAGRVLEGLIRSLQQQRGGLHEIVIADSSSEDNTVEIAKEYNARIVSVARNGFDHGGTRNLAARTATGDILMFVTQDIIPFNTELFEAFVRAFSDAGIAGAYARQIPRENASPVEALSRRFSYLPESRTNTYNSFMTTGVRALYFANPCACVRREVFERLGGFPDRVICNEDMVIAHKMLKAGYKTQYTADAVVYHSHDYKPMQLLRRYVDIGVFFGSFGELRRGSKNSGEGIALALAGAKLLINEGHLRSLPIFFVEILVKFLGYNLGKHFRLYPRSLCRALSMNKTYWSRKS